jgi:hypothetical protein
MELLKTNVNCRLPCWWGFVPETTYWIEVEQFLSYIGAKASNDPIAGQVIVHQTGGFDFGEISIYNSIDFYERAGVVESIRIHAEGYNNPADFKVVWKQYSPEQILSTYGLPSQVWVSSISEAGEPLTEFAPYDLWLVYDTLGFLIRYIGSVKYEPMYRMCPTFKDEGNLGRAIDMVLQSPDNKQPVWTSMLTTLPFTIEEAAGLTIEEFYTLYLQTSQPICFETPREIWP